MIRTDDPIRDADRYLDELDRQEAEAEREIEEAVAEVKRMRDAHPAKVCVLGALEDVADDDPIAQAKDMRDGYIALRYRDAWQGIYCSGDAIFIETADGEEASLILTDELGAALQEMFAFRRAMLDGGAK